MRNINHFFLIIFCLITTKSYSQSTVIEQYIKEGLENHASLKQQKFQLQKSIYMLDEARALFKPNINFNTTYSTAVGGRNISFPVGDLINPIYATLNLITPANYPKFPEGQIPNVNEQLVPKNFYDARIKTQMPLFNAEIKYNQKIKKELIGVQEAEIEVFKRELVKDIKVAYFNYLKSLEAINIFENAKTLLKETERVNRSLIKNEMANPMALIRTQNEQAKIASEAILAENNKKNATYYFNFLLSKPYDNEIIVDTIFNKLPDETIRNEVGTREEFKKIEAAIKVNETILAMNRAYKKPKIGAILDIGSQGSLKDINSKNPFALFGLSFDLPIYSGGRYKIKILEQEQELLSMVEQEKQIKNQLSLQVELTQNTFLASKKLIPAKKTQVETAKRYYNDVMKKYKEGQANYVELFESQTQVTTAELQNSIAIYDSWIRYAEMERANASFNLK